MIEENVDPDQEFDGWQGTLSEFLQQVEWWKEYLKDKKVVVKFRSDEY